MWYTPVVHFSHWLKRTPCSAFYQKNANLKAPSGNKSVFYSETLNPLAPSTGHNLPPHSFEQQGTGINWELGGELDKMLD